MGRVVRNIGRKAIGIDSQLKEYLSRAEKLLDQTGKRKNKLYRIDVPEVKCTSKGKAHKRYEFGCKVNLAVTNKSNWIIGTEALDGNLHDGHTLSKAIEQIERVAGK